MGVNGRRRPYRKGYRPIGLDGGPILIGDGTANMNGSGSANIRTSEKVI
jgi:hypothetical protein